MLLLNPVTTLQRAPIASSRDVPRLGDGGAANQAGEDGAAGVVSDVPDSPGHAGKAGPVGPAGSDGKPGQDVPAGPPGDAGSMVLLVKLTKTVPLVNSALVADALTARLLALLLAIKHFFHNASLSSIQH
uniref:Collagen-like protein n=1 Tax=Panagrellus redivivus TaxID=6233 RepID=A0A7E4VH62_PANRE